MTLCQDCNQQIEKRYNTIRKKKCTSCYNKWYQLYMKQRYQEWAKIDKIIDQDTCGHGDKWLEAY